MPRIPQASLTVVAEFPEHYFLENLAVRADGSILVTAMNKNELWYVPPPAGHGVIQPVLLHAFDLPTLCLFETEKDLFYLGASDVYGTHESELYRIDLNGWAPGRQIEPRLILEFPAPKVGLNGGCMITPTVLLLAGVTDLVWRVDVGKDGSASARVWLKHDNMKYRPGEKKPEQPGINGIRYAARSNYLYYTSTSQQLFMRVKVDPQSLEPAGLPEFIAGGRYWDDFVLDENADLAYATTHRENTIDRVHLAPDGNREGQTVAAGEPFTSLLVGPSSGAWRRGKGDYGKVAYFITDGGTAQPPDGVYRTAKLLQVEFNA